MSYKTRTEFVVAFIKNTYAPRKILDVGFIGEYNRSFIHKALLENFSDDSIVGLDINPEIEQFKNKKNREYVKLSIFDVDTKKGFKEQFNIVVLCEVFEHLLHPFLVLHKIHYCLKEGGMLIITYPNPTGLKKFVRYLLQQDVTEKDFLRKKYLGAPDHKVFPMPPSLVAYLNAAGFETKKVAFIKRNFCGVPILEKLSSYVGIVAVKK